MLCRYRNGQRAYMMKEKAAGLVMQFFFFSILLYHLCAAQLLVPPPPSHLLGASSVAVMRHAGRRVTWWNWCGGPARRFLCLLLKIQCFFWGDFYKISRCYRVGVMLIFILGLYSSHPTPTSVDATITPQHKGRTGALLWLSQFQRLDAWMRR